MAAPRHVPVMCADVLGVIRPRAGGRYVDGTFGAGGYSRAFLDAAECQVIAFDRDPDAIAAGQELVARYGERLRLRHERFSRMEAALQDLGIRQVDGVALDVGVSSMQLDDPARGFSFRQDGPLDLRMERRGLSAAEFVNQAREQDLADVLRVYGEERRARAIARAIVAARARQPLTRTGDLVRVIESCVGAAPRAKIHPATRTFQALRIFINNELEELAKGLTAAERVLAPAGRLAVVAFHSLEDRIVKRFLSAHSGQGAPTSRYLPDRPDPAPAPSFKMLFRKARTPSAAEVAANPRARSARLRAGERTAAPPFPLDLSALGLPRVSPKGVS